MAADPETIIPLHHLHTADCSAVLAGNFTISVRCHQSVLQPQPTAVANQKTGLMVHRHAREANGMLPRGQGRRS